MEKEWRQEDGASGEWTDAGVFAVASHDRALHKRGGARAGDRAGAPVPERPARKCLGGKGEKSLRKRGRGRAVCLRRAHQSAGWLGSGGYDRAMADAAFRRLGGIDVNAMALHELSDVLCDTGLVGRLLDLAVEEDFGFGAGSGGPGAAPRDITSEVSIAPDHHSTYHVVARKPGVAAGLVPLYELTNRWPEIAYAPTVVDGEVIEAGRVVARMAGPTGRVLGIERTYLNLLGRLSGIATRTARFVEAMGTGHRAHLYDTRKTTPGLRVLEKYAVRCGGGRCHRFGLHDAVLLKDNHIAHVPPGELGAFVAEASRRARAIWASGPATLLRPFVEVEVDTLEQFAEILETEPGVVDIVLLDNMEPETLKRAVAMRDGARSTIELEASGGATLESIRAIAMTGVERISVGSVTHGATVLDFGLDAV